MTATDGGARHRLRLAFLGDSIAWGQGAARTDDRLAARLARRLEEDGWVVETRVHAAPGARSTALDAQVRRAIPDRPDVAIIVVGANDLTHQLPAERAAALLGAAVRQLRVRRVEVVLAPAPDLSVVPHIPPLLRQAVRAASQELRARQTQVAQSLGARVADADGATTRAFAADPRLFSADRFHPSSAGYAVIAAALLPEVRAAALALRAAPRG